MKNILIPAALLFAASTVYAGDMPNFTDIDADGDGALTLDEASAVEGFDFNAADADADGSVTLDEYVAAIEG